MKKFGNFHLVYYQNLGFNFKSINFRKMTHFEEGSSRSRDLCVLKASGYQIYFAKTSFQF